MQVKKNATDRRGGGNGNGNGGDGGGGGGDLSDFNNDDAAAAAAQDVSPTFEDPLPTAAAMAADLSVLSRAELGCVPRL
jgi:hypothetical protein